MAFSSYIVHVHPSPFTKKKKKNLKRFDLDADSLALEEPFGQTKTNPPMQVFIITITSACCQGNHAASDVRALQSHQIAVYPFPGGDSTLISLHVVIRGPLITQLGRDRQNYCFLLLHCQYISDPVIDGESLSDGSIRRAGGIGWGEGGGGA